MVPIPPQSCPIINPILPFSGTKLHAETDLTFAGAHPLTLTRQYRSDNGGWMNNFQRSLAVNAVGTITATRPDGSFTLFNPSGTIWQTNASSGANRKDTLTTILIEPPGQRAYTTYQYKVFDTDAVEHYDAQGKLQKIVERNGWTTTLIYSTAAQISPTVPAAGLLIEVRNHFGRKIRFNYNAAKQITQTLDPSGNAINYAYNTQGMLTTVTWQDATSRTYHYENPSFTWALTGITDELGVRYATYGYDAQARVNYETKVGNVDTANISYDAQGNTTVQHVSTTGTQLSSTTISMGLSGGNYQPTGSSAASALCGGYAQTTTYDSAGNKLTELTHAGKHITYTYDAKSRETSRIERTANATGPITYKSVTQWHPTFNLPVWRSEPNRITAWTYDALGQTTGHSETTQNDPTGTLGTAALVAQGDVRNTGWAYNAQRLPILATYVQNPYPTQTYTFTYDSAGNLKTFTQPVAATNTTPANTQTGYLTTYNANGAFTAGTSTTGQAVTHTYNARGKPATQTIAGQTTTYLYDAIGQDKKVTYPDGSKFEYTYSAAHVLTRLTWKGVEVYPTNVIQLNPSANNAKQQNQITNLVTKFAQIFDNKVPTLNSRQSKGNPGTNQSQQFVPPILLRPPPPMPAPGPSAGAWGWSDAGVTNTGGSSFSKVFSDDDIKWIKDIIIDCIGMKNTPDCNENKNDLGKIKDTKRGLSFEGRCEPGMTIQEAQQRLSLWKQELNKRKFEDENCYPLGVNSSHKDRIIFVMDQIKNCAKIIP